MSSKIFSVAILGCGNRGAEIYGTLFFQQSDRFRIVALCDSNPAKLATYGERFQVTALFEDEKEFFKEKRADLLVIATMDRDHIRQCIAGLKLGYDILLEKPITDKKEELEALLAAQKQYGGKILVCHVLRYAPGYLKIAEYLDNGAIGRLVAIQAIEQVAYWHQAHSFVRGNWHSREETAPMILAKCCHDLDLLQYFAKSRCESVSSVGDLTYFNRENAPKEAKKRCIECPLIDTCPYSAKRIYVDEWKKVGSPASDWPYNQLTSAYPITEEALYEALKTGDYGKCVYYCDNDVVDHQLSNFTFENGVKVSLTMTAFTADCGRRIRFFGTLGELFFDEVRDMIIVKRYGQEIETVKISEVIKKKFGHGGGEIGLMQSLYDTLSGNATSATSLEASVESHLMALCAEESRLAGGKLIKGH